MSDFDTSRLSPEIAAYIRALETKVEEENQQQKEQLLKMQSLNEQFANMRKRMFGWSSEKIQYVDGE